MNLAILLFLVGVAFFGMGGIVCTGGCAGEGAMLVGLAFVFVAAFRIRWWRFHRR